MDVDHDIIDNKHGFGKSGLAFSQNIISGSGGDNNNVSANLPNKMLLTRCVLFARVLVYTFSFNYAND